MVVPGDGELGAGNWDRELGTGNWGQGTGGIKLVTGLGTGNWGQGPPHPPQPSTKAYCHPTPHPEK